MSNPAEILRKKRDGGVLSDKEIEFFFQEYLADRIADYHASAWLMAAFINGLSAEETASLTKVMRDSGETLNWEDHRQVADKHSTGGVGDKTSLVILPLCCLEGLTVPMISGRGLGHSGGTLDKLESIPGLNVFLTPEQINALIATHGGAFMGQTGEFAPLDKRLYSLRDVTATVESIGLITASILSKKTAEGLRALVMDVKFGSGAFMTSLTDAKQLAASIKAVGEACGVKVRCLLTDMNSPLGRTAGNALELKECLEILKSNNGPRDTTTLSIRLAAEMVHLFTDEDIESISARMTQNLRNGAAFEKFSQIIHDQGGDISVLENPDLLKQAPLQMPVTAQKTGFITAIDVRELGLCVVDLGGGRKLVQDKIDYSVGLDGLVHVGDKIKEGDTLAIVHGKDQTEIQSICDRIKSAYTIGEHELPRPLIAEIL